MNPVPPGGHCPGGPEMIVIFDGACRFCHAAVRFLLRRDRQARLFFASHESATGRDHCRQHGLDPADLQSVVLIDLTGAYQRSDALLRVLAVLPAPWRWLRVLRVIPRRWRDAIYSFAARHRHCGPARPICPVPPPEWRARFLP